MAIAELSIIPMATADMRPSVDAVVKLIKNSGLKYEVGPMGTTVEGELDQILELVKQAHRTALLQGGERVITELRIDERRSGTVTIERELAGYR